LQGVEFVVASDRASLRSSVQEVRVLTKANSQFCYVPFSPDGMHIASQVGFVERTSHSRMDRLPSRGEHAPTKADRPHRNKHQRYP
jgi:hypothetical protein